MNDINKKIKQLLKDYLFNKLNLEKLNIEINKLCNIKDNKNYEYLNALLYPEKYKGCRIPNSLSIKSFTFQLKGKLSINTRVFDSFLIRINPYFLCNTNCYNGNMPIKYNYKSGNNTIYNLINPYCSLSTFQIFSTALNDYSGVDRSQLLWYPLENYIDIINATLFSYEYESGIQTIPINTYNQYRLVSGCINCKYIGPIDKASGILGGSIFLKQINGLSCMGSFLSDTNKEPIYKPGSATPRFKLGPFVKEDEVKLDYIRDCIYHEEHNILEGIRMLYFPPDNSYNEFIRIYDGNPYTGNLISLGNNTYDKYYDIENIDYYKNGFWWYLYGFNLPKNIDNCCMIEYCFNFECLPSNEMLNYCNMNLDNNNYIINEIELANIYNQVKEKCIQKINIKI